MFAKASTYNMLAWMGDEPLDLQREQQLAFNRFVMSGGFR